MSTFSDPGIIRRLQTEFIPVVGNTHELQNQRSSPAGTWFMKMATSVNPRDLGKITAQGFYISAPDGTGYGFNNNRSAERVNWFMDESLKKWRANRGADVAVTSEDLKAPFSRRPSDGVQVARVYSRIKPMPAGSDVLNHGVAMDHLWIYPSEIAEVAAGLKSGKPTLPRNLLGRVLRYHLVDNIRGEPDFWSPAEISRIDLRCSKAPSGAMRFVLTFGAKTASGARGIEGTMEGEIDSQGNLKAYAEAEAWGAGTYTPRPPAGRFPVKFAITPANDPSSRLVPPQANTYRGNEYESAAIPELRR